MPAGLSFWEDPAHDRWFRVVRSVFIAAVLILPIVAFPLLRGSLPGWLAPVAWFHSLATACGVLVGFSEISVRYRDEPLRATFNRYGVAYLTINGVFSGCAFILLRAFGPAVFPKAAEPPLLAALVAGFGAMVVFRSKLFTFRTDDGKDVGVGPDIVIGSILRVVDRKVDRLRASRRQRLVFERAKLIAEAVPRNSDFDLPNSFVTISLASFQNLSTEEKQTIVQKSDDLKEKLKNQPALLKAMVLGFVVLDVTGEENFDAIMRDLEEYLRSPAVRPAAAPPIVPPAPPPPVVPLPPPVVPPAGPAAPPPPAGPPGP